MKQASKKVIELDPNTNNILELKRKNKEKQLLMQEQAIDLVHEHLEDAVQVLVDGLYDEDKWIRIRSAETLLRKALPDKKTKEITGEGGGPIQIEEHDKRTAVINIIGILDELGFDELRERVTSGRTGILEVGCRTEGETETGVQEQEEAETGGERPGQDQSATESPESVDASEARPRDRDAIRDGEESPRRSRRREMY